ncbi:MULTISPECIES: hypothetical protein [unclassified Microcoleus]|uniref:hypothetical protein n=1 Tax=unclassified Microcoleus TaxID=2642155 RepID=UPI002FD3A2B3
MLNQGRSNTRSCHHQMYSPKIERTIARGTTEEFDAPEKAGIKLRNIAYYPIGDRL